MHSVQHQCCPRVVLKAKTCFESQNSPFTKLEDRLHVYFLMNDFAFDETLKEIIGLGSLPATLNQERKTFHRTFETTILFPTSFIHMVKRSGHWLFTDLRASTQLPNRIRSRDIRQGRHCRHILILSNLHCPIRHNWHLPYGHQLADLLRNVQKASLAPWQAQDLHPDRHADGRVSARAREAGRDDDHGAACQGGEDAVAAGLGRRADFDDEVLLLWIDY